MAEVGAATGARLRYALRALRHRNFRLFTVGQSISLVGTWMQQVAVGWLVYRLTGSAFLLGLVGFVSQVPGFVLAPLAGAVADRVDKRRMVLATQAAGMVQALLLAALVLTDTVTIGWILVLMGLQGAVVGFDVPARQSFLIDMVEDRDDLPNAIALNSSIFNGARLVGPAVAGFLIALVGEGICILLNGVSYVAVLASLLMMRVRARTPGVRGSVLRRMAEGFRYTWDFVPIRAILALVCAVSLLGVPFTVLLPVVATEMLGGGPETLGILMAATGLGAVSAALWLAARPTVRGLGRVIPTAAALFGVCLMGTALSRSLGLSVLLLAGAGFGMMAQMASSNTVLQTLVPDDKRGRVMSLYSMAFLGMAPFGSLAAGAVAARFGAPVALALGGGACVLAGGAFGSRVPRLREIVLPVYARLGILPEVARGLQAATHHTSPDEGD